MRTISPLLLLLILFPAAYAQHEHEHQTSPTATLFSGLGNHHHAVYTNSAEAQKFFDQGLTFIYAFNHDEATRSFKRAAELDPHMAMAYWGVALSVGPNYNMDVDAEREKQAHAAIQKALESIKAAEKKSTSGSSKQIALDRGYIEALAKRYSGEAKPDYKKLAVSYKNAMGELVKRFPDELDAATLFADSAMALRPWKLWTPDGKPAEGTDEIVATLESVLKRNPNHIGAIHFYIHAVEASPDPGRALAYAPHLPGLVPSAGHLVHMPAHIYIRTGNYEAAAKSNADAAEADQAYIQATKAQGMYPLMYYSHNLHFLAVASAMEGKQAESMKAAGKLESYLTPFVKSAPMLDAFMSTGALLRVRFHKWDEIEHAPDPDKNLPVTYALTHFAKGIAKAATGDISGAAAELNIVNQGAKALPAAAGAGNNRASDIVKVAALVLDARIAFAKGDKNDAEALYRKAAAAEDALAYDEPPGWYLPVRESLGGVLISQGRFADAEKVFRDDLARHPKNPRSLFGLHEALIRQHNDKAAAAVKKEFEAAWKHADSSLKIEDLY